MIGGATGQIGREPIHLNLINVATNAGATTEVTELVYLSDLNDFITTLVPCVCLLT